MFFTVLTLACFFIGVWAASFAAWYWVLGLLLGQGHPDNMSENQQFWVVMLGFVLSFMFAGQCMLWYLGID